MDMHRISPQRRWRRAALLLPVAATLGYAACAETGAERKNDAGASNGVTVNGTAEDHRFELLSVELPEAAAGTQGPAR